VGGIEILSIVITAFLGALPPLLKSLLEVLYKRSPQRFELPLAQDILRLVGVRTQPAASGTKNLLIELKKAATDMDRIMDAISRYTEERQASVAKLESDLQSLSQREQELKTTINNLEKTPLPAAKYFAELVEKTEKRSARRDYTLFLLGVVGAAVVAIVLKAIGVG
jgi:hypothetical protein